MIPTWLQPILDAKGVTNADGVSRAARARHCRRCGRTTLRGLDADRAAIAVTVDPTPINTLGEFLAISAGRITYDLEWRGGRYELSPREPAHIQAAPARLRARRQVVVSHSCGSVMPAEGLLDIIEVEERIGNAAPF